VAQTLWPLRGLVGRGYGDSDPPITRFVAEQLSTAHWFDQRRTREALAWTPRVSIDEGLDELARWYRQVG
jgi:nucleoside-diphosphate-sugar epimerase